MAKKMYFEYLKRYGFIGTFNLLYCKLRTIILFKQARLIRFPFEIRNKHLMSIGNSFTCGVGCRLEVETYDNNGFGKKLIIGDNVQMNDYVHITANKSVIIGDNVLLASKIYISDCAHGDYGTGSNTSSPLSKPIDRPLISNSVVIEDNVWLGEFVSVLPGVTIGKGSIVGANSVVSKSLPSNVIAVGSPAKPIKKFNFESQKWEKIISI